MKTPAVLPATPPAASVSEFVATFGLILGAIAALLLFDTALARLDSNGRKSYAAHEFVAGEQLLRQGQIEEAMEHLRTATMLDADNSSYAVALAQATLADGRPDAAEEMVLPLLERDPTDGAANLAMARVLEKEKRTDEAKFYYHRAIYGLWPSGADAKRSAARFELIDLLARANAKEELLAELLPIQDDSTNDPAQLKRIAHLFVVAGSPARAVVIFRQVQHRDPRDPDAFIGLAEAALSLGDFATARADLGVAQKLMPDDSTSLLPRLALVDSVIALDPTLSGLSLAEQVRRSKNLMQMTLASVRRCLGVQAPQVAVALDSARLLLTAPMSAGQGQSIEQTLSVAEQLWGLQRSRCAPEPEDGALALIHNRISH